MIKKLATYICMFLIGTMGFLGTSQKTIINGELITGTHATCYYESNGAGSSDTAGEDCSGKTTQSTEMQKMLNSLVSALNIILDVLTIIVTPAMILASWLMSPDWTSGDLFQIRPMLHDLWITVANITYFIYAVLLIFIALATIFNSEKYGYKQLLPRLALGILLVPLTWWFIQFIISLSTIVTASVVSIPMEVVNEYTKKNSSSNWWTEPSIPAETKFSNDKTDKDAIKQPCAGSTNATQAQNTVQGPIQTQACISPEKFIEKAGGMYSNLMLYSFAVFRFQDVKMLNGGTKDTILSIGQIINQGLIGAIMFIVYGLLVLALVFMLMMRAIKLWFYAIFSPLMTLKYVVGDGFFGGKENGDTFDLKEFIGLAFVPALVGLALSFGLVIVSVMMGPAPKNNSSSCSDESCTIQLFGVPDNKIETKIVGDGTNKKTETTVSFGGAKYIFSGDVGPGSVVNGVKGALNTTGGIIGTIIIDIIALIFIWVAFMAAKNVSKAVKAAVSPFEDFGKKIGGLASSLPKYAPILPGGLSMSGATKAVSAVESSVMKSDSERFEKSSIGKMLGAEKNIPDDTAKKLTTAIKNGDTGNVSPTDLATIRDIMRNYGSREMAYNSGAPEAFIEKMKGMDKSGKDEYLKRLEIGDHETRKKIIEFTESSKGKLHSDSEKKEFLNMMVNALAGARSQSSQSNGINGVSINQVGTTDNYTITFNGGSIEADVKSKTTQNLTLDPTKISDKSLGKKDEYKKSLIETLRGKIGVDVANKVADEIMKKIPDDKFTN